MDMMDADVNADRVRVMEEIIDNLHLSCDEAQDIANRISGPRGKPNCCPDGVQVLEDAETLIRATVAHIINHE